MEFQIDNKRISREACNIRIASLIALRGTCARLQVGAVITRNNKIVATGYNGPGKDQEHCNKFMCRTDEPCKRAIHAEANAIDILPHTNWNVEEILYCTHQPCKACANKILAFTKISKIYYLHEYRDKSGLELLKQHRPEIEIHQINEQGEIIDGQELS